MHQGQRFNRAGNRRNVVSNHDADRGGSWQIIEATDKAIKLEATTRNGKAFPRGFLARPCCNSADGAPTGRFQLTAITTQLQHWFRPNGWTARFSNYDRLHG
jgi:hypothetical protein